ncbi:MAG: DUF5721 family protein [Defluviitaleaceae bacterium]|nr:DUF5721 family protein [Defluviitaleaceae bacterium]
MLSLSIVDIKDFMGKLLKEEIFDNFDLHSLLIQNFACFEVHKTSDQPAPKWSAVRPFAFDVVKRGGATPKSLKVVLAAEGSLIDAGDATLFFNAHFEEGKITITTGFSQKSFSMDKSGQGLWDNYIQKFLIDKKIEFIDNLA